MPDIPIKIHTIGDKEAVKSVKDVNSVIKEMARLSKNSAFGEMNSKQVEKANKILGKFNTTQEKTIKLAKEYGKEVNVLNKALKATEDIYGKSKEGRKVLSELTKMRDEARMSRNRLTGAVNRGTGISNDLRQSAAQSGKGGGLMGGQLMGGFMDGIGLEALSMAGIGLMIGKVVGKAFAESSKNLATITSSAGIARGNLSGLLNTSTGFWSSDINAGANLLGFGTETRQKVQEAIYGQTATGATPTEKSVLDAMAMSRMGVSMNQSNALLSGQVSGVPALSTMATRDNPNAGKDLVNFKRIMSEAVTTGMTGVRSGEFVDGINQLVDLTQRTASTVNVNKIGDMLAAAARIGSPAFQGARGAENMASLQSALLNPGGGIAGKMLALEAGGFGTSTNSVIKAQMNLEQGLTRENVGGVLGRLRGRGLGGAAALSEFTGGRISITNANDLLNTGFTTPGAVGKKRTFHIEDLMDTANPQVQAIMGQMPLQQQDLIAKFKDLIDKAGPAAGADLTKQQMVEMLMDPLVASANALQVIAFGSSYGEKPTERADLTTHHMVSRAATGAAKPIQQPAPVPGATPAATATPPPNTYSAKPRRK